MHVFEFGSGPTLWWANLVEEVRGGRARRQLVVRMPRCENVSFLRVPLEPDGDYCRTAPRSGQKFHVIGDDGHRVNCAKQCVKALRDDGVIVWDDSRRKRYRPGFRFLHRR